MTPSQLQIIHIAKARVFGREGDASYRMLLKNVAGVASSKDLDNRAFEDVMAVMEDSGFRDTRGDDYWRSKVRMRSAECGERMAGKIYALAKDGRYALPAMVRRFSADRTDQVERLLPREAWNLIEGLKAIAAREGGDPTKQADGPSLFAGKEASGMESPRRQEGGTGLPDVGVFSGRRRPSSPLFAPVTDDEVPF